MRRFLYILALFFIYILLCARSCDNGSDFRARREQMKLQYTRDSISAVFSSYAVSPNTLHAFEENAKIKFTDLLDYLEIFTDPDIAPEFRQHTGQMIRDLFLSENCLLHFTGRHGKAWTNLSVNELVNTGPVFRKSMAIMQPDSLWIERGLHLVNDSTFYGKIGFSSSKPLPDTDNQSYYPAGGYIDFYAVQRIRNFGSDTLKIWTVLLGENGY
jgi:hypothetical protein